MESTARSQTGNLFTEKHKHLAQLAGSDSSMKLGVTDSGEKRTKLLDWNSCHDHEVTLTMGKVLKREQSEGYPTGI